MLSYSIVVKLIKVLGGELRQNYCLGKPMLILLDQLSASALCLRKSHRHKKTTIRQLF